VIARKSVVSDRRDSKLVGVPPSDQRPWTAASQARPLAGVRVLDLTRLLPGGFCSLLLADYGAEVLKLEDTGAGDYMRWWPPHFDGAEPSAAAAGFIALNRGKRSIRVDLKSDAGRTVMRRLVREHDVVLESFRPGVLSRLGLGYEQLRDENPRIVYCALSGYGSDGPCRDRAGHDLNYSARAGIVGLTGEAGGSPVQSAVAAADIGAATAAAFAILAALRGRDSSGQGQFVDVSMTDVALSFLAVVAAQQLAGASPARRGEGVAYGGSVCYQIYRCADGWVTLAALESKFWRTWCVGVERIELVPHQLDRVGSQAHAEIEQIFLARTRSEWAAFALEHDCCLDPVLDLDEVLTSELVARRGMLRSVAQPGTDATVRTLGTPVKLGVPDGSGSETVPMAAAPTLGEHTHEVLSSIGYSQSEILALEAAGAVAGAGVEEIPDPFLH
jgi:alpha-methylacyl-CoA racemase